MLKTIAVVMTYMAGMLAIGNGMIWTIFPDPARPNRDLIAMAVGTLWLLYSNRLEK